MKFELSTALMAIFSNAVQISGPGSGFGSGSGSVGLPNIGGVITSMSNFDCAPEHQFVREDIFSEEPLEPGLAPIECLDDKTMLDQLYIGQWQLAAIGELAWLGIHLGLDPAFTDWLAFFFLIQCQEADCPHFTYEEESLWAVAGEIPTNADDALVAIDANPDITRLEVYDSIIKGTNMIAHRWLQTLFDTLDHNGNDELEYGQTLYTATSLIATGIERGLIDASMCIPSDGMQSVSDIEIIQTQIVDCAIEYIPDEVATVLNIFAVDLDLDFTAQDLQGFSISSTTCHESLDVLLSLNEVSRGKIEDLIMGGYETVYTVADVLENIDVLEGVLAEDEEV